MTDWRNLVHRFCNQKLSKPEWTHEAHLVVALWHLVEYESVERAMCFLRPGIILFNHSVGTANTDVRGYHETITMFWVRQIHAFIQRQESRDFDVLVERLLAEAAFLEKGFILRFYSEKSLQGPLARGTYISQEHL